MVFLQRVELNKAPIYMLIDIATDR